MKNSKFAPPPKPFKERAKNFAQSMLFWKGRRKGMIHTSDVKLEDIRAVFFPKNFHEKYRYLGSIPWNENGSLFAAMESLVIFMDYKARPAWCPRWFLRFLHLFGSDNSVVRVRNRRLHNLQNRLTRGIFMYDYKTKWEWYDLRISVSGDQQIQNLADDIEERYYYRGERQELKERILKKNPERKQTYWGSNRELAEELNSLQID